MLKRGLPAVLLVLLLVFSPLFSTAATSVSGNDTTAALDSATTWLAQATPEPLSGDDWLVFTLLRSGKWQPTDTPVQNYLRDTLAQLEDGGVLQQSLTQNAVQGLTLAAAGINLATTRQDLLLNLCDAEALAQAGLDAQLPTLLLFATMGAEIPQSVIFNPTGVARAIAATQNADGGYGVTSNAKTTAEVLLALAPFVADEAISTHTDTAQLWLQANCSSNGALIAPDGNEDIAATAITVLAMDTLGYNPQTLSYNTPSMVEYLYSLQSENGSWQQDYSLTLLCTAALAAQSRYDNAGTRYFSSNDIIPTDPKSLQAQSSLLGGTLLNILTIGIVVSLLTGCCLFILRKHRQKRN